MEKGRKREKWGIRWGKNGSDARQKENCGWAQEKERGDKFYISF